MTGWFADIGREGDAMPGMWQPCLDLDTGHIPCFDVWFKTKAECEAYIRDEIIPAAGRMTDG